MLPRRAAAETSFQRGLRDFGKLLVRITAVLVDRDLRRSTSRSAARSIDAVLFSLAIAVGHDARAAAGDRHDQPVDRREAYGAAKSVLVRRLVAIEDFGNIQVLFTDKTGTLTEGTITFAAR